MSMFSGLTNQISGWVANKQGKNEEEDGTAAPENGSGVEDAGEEGKADTQQSGGGGVSGMAQGFLSKAMAAKDGMKEKVHGFHPPNLHGLGNNLISGVSHLIPGRKEEEVPTPPEPNPPSDMGGEMVESGEEIIQE